MPAVHYDSSICSVQVNGDVFHVKVKDGADFTENGLLDLLRFFEKTAQENPYYVITDARDISIDNVNKDAFKINANNAYTPHRRAEAFIVNSLGIRILANFYIKTFRPAIPARCFTTEQEAINWIGLQRLNTR